MEVVVSTFRVLIDEVRRNVPDVLLATMTILFTNYKQVKASAKTPFAAAASTSGITSDGGREKHLTQLREQAKAVITFAGMIPYRMPGDTNARLVQMEVQMN